MNVMVCGSRHWEDWSRVYTRIAELPRSVTILHGGAAGADTYAHEIARSLGFTVEVHEPDYRRPSPQRYHERNDAMLAKADLVLAFWDGESSGTRSVIDKARRMGVMLDVIR